MTKFKKMLIAVLICANVTLLAGLLYSNMSTAEAQMMPYKTTNYITSTVQVGSNLDAFAVIDLASRKLVVWKWNTSSRKVEPIRGGRNLVTDFRKGR